MRRHSDGNRHGTGHACVAMEPRDWLGGRGGGVVCVTCAALAICVFI